MPHFDGTITLGNILSFAGFVVLMLKMHVDNRERLARIEERAASTERRLERIDTRLEAFGDNLLRWIRGKS